MVAFWLYGLYDPDWEFEVPSTHLFSYKSGTKTVSWIVFYQFIYHVKIALSICKSLVISAKMLMWLFSLFSTCHVTWMISFYRLWDWTFFGSALLVGHSSPEACFLLIYQPFSAQTRSFFSIAVCFLFFVFSFFLTCHIKFSCQENPDYKKIVLNLFLWNT